MIIHDIIFTYPDFRYYIEHQFVLVVLGIKLKPYLLQVLRQKLNAYKYMHEDTYKFVALQALYHVKLFIV